MVDPSSPVFDNDLLFALWRLSCRKDYTFDMALERLIESTHDRISYGVAHDTVEPQWMIASDVDNVCDELDRAVVIERITRSFKVESPEDVIPAWFSPDRNAPTFQDWLDPLLPCLDDLCGFEVSAAEVTAALDSAHRQRMKGQRKFKYIAPKDFAPVVDLVNEMRHQLRILHPYSDSSSLGRNANRTPSSIRDQTSDRGSQAGGRGMRLSSREMRQDNGAVSPDGFSRSASRRDGPRLEALTPPSAQPTRTPRRPRVQRVHPYRTVRESSVRSSRSAASSSVRDAQHRSESLGISEHDSQLEIVSEREYPVPPIPERRVRRAYEAEHDLNFGKTIPIPGYFTLEQRAELYDIQMQQAEDKKVQMSRFYNGTKLDILFRKRMEEFEDDADAHAE
jgi:hypothetical protein